MCLCTSPSLHGSRGGSASTTWLRDGHHERFTVWCSAHTTRVLLPVRSRARRAVALRRAPLRSVSAHARMVALARGGAEPGLRRMRADGRSRAGSGQPRCALCASAAQLRCGAVCAAVADAVPDAQSAASAAARAPRRAAIMAAAARVVALLAVACAVALPGAGTFRWPCPLLASASSTESRRARNPLQSPTPSRQMRRTVARSSTPSPPTMAAAQASAPAAAWFRATTSSTTQTTT